MMFITLSLVLLCSVAPVFGSVALGNLAVVIRPKADQLISTDENPVTAATSDLWCQASVDNSVAEITWARFIRARDRKQFEAVLDENNKKARMVFGDSPVTNGGKYRCEMRTANGDLVYGNMFAYVRPVIHTNGSRVMKISEHDPTLVEADSVSVATGETVELHCPVVAYPLPNIVWYKDRLPLEDGGRVKITKNSAIIENVEKSDIGTYRCVATNQFATVVDGPEQEFEIKMDQVLELSGNYGWILPLVIILITLLLVFICIYAWQACSKYNSSNYNVARREQNLRREEEQRGLTKDVN